MKRRALASVPALLLLQTQLGSSSSDDTKVELVDFAVETPVEMTDGSIVYESPSVIDGNLPVFFEQLKTELTYPLAWGKSSVRNFQKWKATAREKVETLLCQPEDDTPFDPTVVDEQDAGDYVRRLIVFNVTRHSRVRASMLVPKGKGPFPAVLLLHDHGAKYDIGKEKGIEPWYDETRLASAQAWSTKYFSGQFVGDALAARGYVVLSVDALGWGDRSGLAYDGQQALASNLFNLGSSLAGLVAREDVRAAALLASLSEVDRDSIAAVGFSMGGYRAWQVAALSDHIAAGASICWMTTMADMMVAGNNTLRGQSAYFMLHPGLSNYLDIPDVASIAAPKPMLFFDGEKDTLFTSTGVNGAYDKMRAVWRTQRAEDRFHTKIWPGLGHIFTAEMQAEAFTWLDSAVSR